MANLFELSAQTRTSSGKADARRLRRIERKVLATVYGAGKAPVSVTVLHKHFEKALQNEAFYSHILTLNIDGQEEKVVLKDLQRHPSRPVIMHADFMRISATDKLTMHVPLHFLNEDKAPGVKLQGGVISHMLNEVEVRCLPADLPEYIAVDLAALDLDQMLHLSDLKLPKGVELVALSHQDNRPVVNIHMPAVVEEVEGPVVVPPAEVPVIGKEAKEGETTDDSGAKK